MAPIEADSVLEQLVTAPPEDPGNDGAYSWKRAAKDDDPPMPARPQGDVEYCPTHGVYV